MPDGSFLGGLILPETSGPGQFRQPLSIRQAAEAKKRLAKRMKYLRTASLVGGVRALESYSLDERPFMSYTERYKNLFVAGGWCCTGFALAPVFGRYIAATMSGNKTKFP